MDPPGQTNETNATNGYPPGRYFRGNLHHSVRCKMIRNNDQLEMRDNRRIIRSRFGIIAYVYCGMSGPFSWRTRLEKKKKRWNESLFVPSYHLETSYQSRILNS